MRYLFLHISDLPPPACNVQWGFYDGEGQCTAQASQPVEMLHMASVLAARAVQDEYAVILLLPAHAVMLREIQVKQQYAKHLRSAIAHLIEDRLAQSMEEVHIAIGKAAAVEINGEKAQNCRIAAIDDGAMQALLRTLAAVELVPSVITSEALLLPCVEETGTVMLDDDRVLFRLSPSIASSLEHETFLLFLETYLGEWQNPPSETGGLSGKIPRTLQIMAEEGALIAHAAFIGRMQALCGERNITVEIKAIAVGIFEWLCCQWFDLTNRDDTLNLLQGPYRVVNPLRLARFKNVAFVVLGLIAATIIFDIGMILYCNEKADQFNSRSIALYHALFPHDTKIVDLEAQAQQHLNGASRGSAEDFVSMLHILSQNTDLARHIDTERLAYDDGHHELTLNFQTDDFAVMDKYKQQAVPPSFILELGSAVREENRIRGEIRIRRKR